MSVFSDAADIIFTDPNISDAALWRAGGAGAPQAVRIVRKRPDEIVGFGASRAVRPTVLIDVRQSEVAMPMISDTVTIGSSVYTIIAEPVGDSLGLVWTCQASL
jgi:hypothetical protein